MFCKLKKENSEQIPCPWVCLHCWIYRLVQGVTFFLPGFWEDVLSSLFFPLPPASHLTRLHFPLFCLISAERKILEVNENHPWSGNYHNCLYQFSFPLSILISSPLQGSVKAPCSHSLPASACNQRVTGVPQSSVPFPSFGHLPLRSLPGNTGKERSASGKQTLHGPYEPLAAFSPPHAPTISMRYSSTFSEHCFAELVSVFLAST